MFIVTKLSAKVRLFCVYFCIKMINKMNNMFF